MNFVHNSQTYLLAPSRSKRGIDLSVKVSQSVLLENAAVRMGLKSVRWKESLTSSSSKMDTTENCFSSQSSKNPPCQTAPQTSASLQSKPPQKGSLLVIKSSAVNVCASPGSCPQIAAIVCKCAQLCSVANQNPRSADQFAAIACNLHSISALLLPLLAWRPPRCLALPRIFPQRTSDVSRLSSPYRRILGTISSLRRFCL